MDGDHIKCSHNKPRQDCITCYRETLPIFPYKETIVNAIQSNPFVIVQAETGSGKSTQLPQYLMEAGYTGIVCTQPRRIAAVSLASRVAKEVNCTLSTTVGYKVRFEQAVSDQTILTYSSDGSLLRELLCNPHAEGYSVIIIDEVHERSVSTDILCALLKKICLEARNDLKIVITSATLDIDKFTTFFDNAAVIQVPGKLFPVDVAYVPDETIESLVYNIHTRQPPGDILAFFAGQSEIFAACDSLKKLLPPNEVIIMPLYACLPLEEQNKVFAPTPKGIRKIICSTNAAETSITIEGIVYVVDTGYARFFVHNPKSGIEMMSDVYVDKQSAEQRRGRAGRVRPGTCYRLYSHEHFSQLEAHHPPEIVRSRFSKEKLTIISLGLQKADFIDPPSDDADEESERILKKLALLDADGNLTEDGKVVSLLPILPALGRVLINANQLKCLKPVIIIVAMMNNGHRITFKGQYFSFNSKFYDETGDHMTFYNLYNAWLESGKSDSWCLENSVNPVSLNQAYLVNEQIRDLLAKKGFQVDTCQEENIVRAFLLDSLDNVAEKSGDEGDFSSIRSGRIRYCTMDRAQIVYLYPASPLGSSPPELVLFNEIVCTKKPFMNYASKIERSWLTALALRKLHQTDIQSSETISLKPSWMGIK